MLILWSRARGCRARCPRRLTKVAAGALGLLALVGLAISREAAADEVFDWNITGFEATAAGGQNSIVISRTVTMMQLAVHDALNAIERRYEPYLYEGRAEPSAAPAAAIAAAARDVLVGMIPAWGKPEQRAKALAIVDSAYGAALAKVPDGLPKNQGIALGQAAAAAMLAARKADGSSVPPQYTPGTAPGHWRPHPNPVPPNPPIPDPALAAGNWPAMLPQWGQVAPFIIATPWQFRLPGPPALASTEYARDYEEVKRMGGKNSTADGRAVGDCPLLVRGFSAGLESHRACRGGSARARRVGQCTATRPRQRGDCRRLHCRRRHTLPLQLLAAGDGNPRRRRRWE